MTSPTKVESVDQAALSYTEDLCKGAALTDVPFGNSSTGGDGLTAQTAYIICTAEQFNNIGSSSVYWTKHFVLLQNINMISYSSLTYNKIGNSTTPFTGVLNGNNKRLLNLSINGSSSYSGVFGVLGANGIVKNLQLSNVLVSGDSYVGILVGENQGGEIRNVTITAPYVSGQGDYVGGLVGKNSLGSIYDSSITFTSAAISVQGDSNVGGLVGKMDYGLIQDSFVTGMGVYSSVNYAGGLVGTNDAGGQIRSSYAKFTTSVSGAGVGIGGVVGNNNGLIYQSYVELPKVMGANYIGGIVGYNDAGLVQESRAKITTQVSGAGDIGGGVGYNATGTVLSSYSEAVLVTGTSNNVGGLIGRNVSGTITSSYAKVTTVSSTIGAGVSNVGGLVGLNGTGLGKIENSYAETTNITATTGENVGGLVGYNTGGEVKNSYAKSSNAITGTSYVGGLIGYNGSGYLSSSYADVKGVTASTNYVGGFVGRTNTGSNISKSYAKSSGTISSPSVVGGFAGYDLGGQIVESYALPTTITGTTSLIGGFVGHLAGSSYLMNVYVRSDAGTLTGNTIVGGFVGRIEDSTIINSYSVWNLVTGAGEYIGGHTGIASNSNIDNSFCVASVSGISALTPPSVGMFIGLLPTAATPPLINKTLELAFADWEETKTCTNSGGLTICNDSDRTNEAVYPPDPDNYEFETGVDFNTTFYYKTSAPLSSWDFTNIWKENTSDYPSFR
ncbi:MAG: hypothetical protein HYV97_17615 [Bdellovibrio sp.]|nr:hypothetical protein [Bdellovibrio sp.]